ncbi:MAG: mannose-1-phosphate guanylyltransferase/mannose-6-phosphate isomerase [Betaproteobacteria bacterium]|nr:mannose-1-phosphate guanylyltransferase/mannose-6-phosphate isomerase [Betaproteobacteria bacterium]
MASTPIKNDLFASENIYSIILCGGSGTRLWPLSRKLRPKQFLALGGTEDTLLQTSIDRVKNISPEKKRWIVTANAQEGLAKEQTAGSVARIISEPQPRNTAPAVALAAWQLMQQDPDSVMLVLSSDHSIQNVRSFEQTVADAVKLARQNLFVTVGIQPTYPATGFGYIEWGLPLDKNAQILPAAKFNETPQEAVGFSVRSFREKPNQAAAEQFIRTGKYLWNAGIFVWKTRTFWNAFSHIQPEMAKIIENMTPASMATDYAKLESQPIDIAFIEQTSHVACVPALFDWNDVGSWSAVRECFEQDNNGNSIAGDAYVSDTRNSVIHSSGPFVATIGVENLVVVATPDAVLVMPTSRSQDVKKVIAHLEGQNRTQLL